MKSNMSVVLVAVYFFGGIISLSAIISKDDHYCCADMGYNLDGRPQSLKKLYNNLNENNFDTFMTQEQFKDDTFRKSYYDVMLSAAEEARALIKNGQVKTGIKVLKSVLIKHILHNEQIDSGLPLEMFFESCSQNAVNKLVEIADLFATDVLNEEVKVEE
ncbi:uncharacterized protein LOC126840153 [Adelges cooleyi]|uniref:uncharacterized protein LOC126840153 n=1 Tax=Adelges cooleyi TaxID=133065 RepID=UPI00217F2A1C|nr:uncharacterized protein LOC126840153 [Adelges cooleyi]XP_050431658.1 uncharacterized protein LOC126840153 [Adelges cooleyi]